MRVSHTEGTQPPRTGDAEVDGVLEHVAAAADGCLDDRVAALTQAHQALTDRLGGRQRVLPGRPAGGPDTAAAGAGSQPGSG